MIITIDGPIATGKSSIAKKLAHRLGFIFFDTGAMYRCVTYALIKNKIDVDNPTALKEFLKDFTFEIKLHHGDKRYFIGDEDVTEKIRGREVTAHVSKVSAIGAVRQKFVELQRHLAEGVNVVFEGRDMGTEVFPDAEVKIFLAGRTEVRAQRRYQEMLTRFPEEAKEMTIESLMEEINKRDFYDTTRELSPLRQAEDAILVDTSDLTIDEVVDKILDYIDILPA